MVLGQKPLIAVKIQTSHFNILKSIETFLFQSYSNAKNTNKTKKPRTNFDLTTYSEIRNIKLFKIHISQLIANVLLKQGILNQIRHCLTGHDQI